MRNLLALALCFLFLATPALAQRSYYFGGSGSSAAANPDETYNLIGWDGTTNVTGTVVSSGTTAVKGTPVDFGAVGSDLAGFWVRVHTAGSSSTRYLLDIGTSSGGAQLLPDIGLQPAGSTSSRVMEFYVPRQVAAATHLWARVSSTGNSQTITLSFRGVLANSTTAPGFTTTTALTTPDTANTRACSTGTNITGAGALTWTQLVASTAAQYGAVLLNAGATASNPTIQQLNISLATGAAASEVAFGWGAAFDFNTTEPRMNFNPRLFAKTIAASERISANVQGITPGAPDTVCLQLFGFS